MYQLCGYQHWILQYTYNSVKTHVHIWWTTDCPKQTIDVINCSSVCHNGHFVTVTHFCHRWHLHRQYAYNVIHTWQILCVSQIHTNISHWLQDLFVNKSLHTVKLRTEALASLRTNCLEPRAGLYPGPGIYVGPGFYMRFYSNFFPVLFMYYPQLMSKYTIFLKINLQTNLVNMKKIQINMATQSVI